MVSSVQFRVELPNSECWLARTSGEHEHTIVGYSLVKGIGDGEPIASERFSVGGHEWVSLCKSFLSQSMFVTHVVKVGSKMVGIAGPALLP